MEILLLPDQSAHCPPQLPAFHVRLCLAAFASVIASTSCAVNSSLEPPTPANLLLAVATGVSLLWTLASLHVRKKKKNKDTGLITTWFGTRKPGHRGAGAGGLKLPFWLVEVVDEMG